MFLDSFGILLLLAIFPLPFAGLWLLLRGAQTAEDLIDSFAFGAASAFCVLYVCAFSSIGWFWWCWLAALLAGLAAWRYLRERPPAVAWSSEIKSVGLVLLLYLAIRVLPSFFQALPHGWDPYFHLVLADRVLETRKLIEDWLPYETARLNYTLGSHLLLALASDALGVPVHKVFVIAISFFTTMTAAQVYVLAWRATGERELALYAAAAFAFMALMGSLDYHRWGGLPNLIGVYLYLAILSLLLRKEATGCGSSVAFGVLFVGLSLVHHHVMLAAGLSLGWLLLHFLARRDRENAYRVLRGLSASAVLGLPYFSAYLLRAGSLQDTTIFEYIEPIITPDRILRDVGAPFFYTACFGLLMYRFARPKRNVSPVLVHSLLPLVFCFVLLEYVSRFISGTFLGREIGPFTPSRFITDAIPLLSVFAGLFLLELRKSLGRSQRFVVRVAIACFALNLSSYAVGFQPVVRPEKAAAYAWVRANANPDAIVFDDHVAAAYMTRRASSSMPYPASEPIASTTVRRIAMEASRSGKIPESVGQRQIVHLYSGDPKAIAPPQILWRHPSGLMVIQINPERTVDARQK